MQTFELTEKQKKEIQNVFTTFMDGSLKRIKANHKNLRNLLDTDSHTVRIINKNDEEKHDIDLSIKTGVVSAKTVGELLLTVLSAIYFDTFFKDWKKIKVYFESHKMYERFLYHENLEETMQLETKLNSLVREVGQIFTTNYKDKLNKKIEIELEREKLKSKVYNFYFTIT